MTERPPGGEVASWQEAKLPSAAKVEALSAAPAGEGSCCAWARHP